MGQNWFERWSHSVASMTGPSRRGVVRAVAGLALAGLVGHQETAAKHHKKKKKKKPSPTVPPDPPPPQCPVGCPVCQACTNGQACTPAAHDDICEDNPCKTCQNGACVNTAGDTPCDDDNPCKTCQNGACVNKAGDTRCDGDGRCLNGVCNQPPYCTSSGAGCFTDSGPPCCAGADTCRVFAGSEGLCETEGAAGATCYFPDDCTAHQCIGFRCQ
jgi:hypothetical protein